MHLFRKKNQFSGHSGTIYQGKKTSFKLKKKGKGKKERINYHCAIDFYAQKCSGTITIYDSVILSNTVWKVLPAISFCFNKKKTTQSNTYTHFVFKRFRWTITILGCSLCVCNNTRKFVRQQVSSLKCQYWQAVLLRKIGSFLKFQLFIMISYLIPKDFSSLSGYILSCPSTNLKGNCRR